MTTPELQDALASKLLPLLELNTLAFLACTCTTLRGLAYQRPAVWTSSAAKYLPPEHPSLSGLRPEVQSVMRRRASARQALMSGQVGNSVKLHADIVEHVMFSACGELIAVRDFSEIAVFSACDGIHLWHMKTNRDVHNFGTVKFATWHFGKQQLMACSAPWDWELESPIERLILLTIDSQSGTLLGSKVLEFGSLPEIEGQRLECYSDVVFSPSGNLLALPVLCEAAEVIEKEVVVVVDVETGTVRLVSSLPEDLDNLPTSLVWSADESKIAYGRIIHLSDGCIVELYEGELFLEDTQFEDVHFNRTGSVLGSTLVTTTHRPKRTAHSAMFYNSFTGEELLKIDQSVFVSFCTASGCAMVMLSTNCNFQCWDVMNQHCLSTTDFGVQVALKKKPCLLLDGKLILGKLALAQNRMSNKLDCFQLSSSNNMSLQLNAASWELSPDECTLAVVHHCKPKEARQAISLYRLS